GQFLLGWLGGTARPRLRPRTFSDYSYIVKEHLVPAFGAVPLLKLGPEHIRGLFADKTAEGLSARRVRVIRAVLHTALARRQLNLPPSDI
nr:N-terminal phage integrase SAM-like domain-containing protein [Acidobacteriota bacterium]